MMMRLKLIESEISRETFDRELVYFPFWSFVSSSHLHHALDREVGAAQTGITEVPFAMCGVISICMVLLSD